MRDPNEQEQPKQPSPDLLDELRVLGQNVEKAVRTTVDTARIHSVQRDVVAGMQEFFHRMQETAQRFQQNQSVQNLTERGQQALNQAQESQVARDIQETLARVVAYSNQQLQEFTERRQRAEQQSSTTTQRVPIADESTPPVTGQTVRLDEDGTDKS